MSTYIQVSGCTWVADFSKLALGTSPSKDEQDLYITWTKMNIMIVGSIKLHLSESLKQKYQA